MTAQTNSAPTIDELVGKAIPYLRRVFPAVVLAAIVCVGLAVSRNPAWGVAAALVAVGGLVPIGVWIFRIARGLPFLAVVAAQDLLWFGLPLASGHQEVSGYSDEEVLSAGLEILIYAAAMTLTYLVFVSRPLARPSTYLTLRLADPAGLTRAVWACLFALAVCCAYKFASLNGSIWPYLNILPNGTASILNAALSVVGTAASLLLAFAFARRSLSPLTAGLFFVGWTLFVATAVANVYVSAIAAPAAAVAFGMFLGRGRLPWRFMASILLVAIVLNFGKFTMRERYWNDDADRVMSVTDLPAYYAEWLEASWAAVSKASDAVSSEDDGGQSLVDRMSTYHMLLFVQREITRRDVEPLGGAGYVVIPKLLVPRVLWKDKPRSQIGQVLLNVHFGRQTLEQTHTTYISWGLLPEGYGNFGPVIGAVFVGVTLGALLALLERQTFGLPFDSLTALLNCVFFLSLTGINERVASTSLTMAFQMSMVVLLGSLPFLSRVSTPKPAPSFGPIPDRPATAGAPGSFERRGRYRT